MWSFKGDALNLEPVSHIKLENNFTPTCIVHPDTYLNKVLKNVLTC
jgi:U3 small nucleolar RNA-associated protein 21